VLRDGPWTETPFKLNRQTVSIPTPEDFRSTVKEASINILPLSVEGSKPHHPGWCTYSDVFDSPECEVLSGGVNSKTPTAAAIWRQGHLLHFGFDLEPKEMNERCQQLLINSMVYIARFTEDRPITHVPDRAIGLAAADRQLKNKEPNKNYLDWFFGSGQWQKQGDWPAFQKWYGENRAYLRSDRGKEGALVLDEEARAMGVPIQSKEFVATAIKALGEGGNVGKRAQVLLERYVVEGPKEKTAAGWKQWWQEHEGYVFFSESGWYRWYVDPLAKKRGVSPEKCRGIARATR
jgi:hypothetical protein